MSTIDGNRNRTVRLEAATEADLEQILLLQKRAFSGQAKIYHDPNLPSLTQTLDDLRKEFNEKTFYKVVRNGTIIASIRCGIRDRALSIEKLFVDPDLQDRGIGTAIMGALESRYAGSVDRYVLSTGHKSARNLHLYGKLGYKETGRKRLNENCDLIVMEKSGRT
jgi:ribosomal protein S18 acetylase RimI-like enzyme